MTEEEKLKLLYPPFAEQVRRLLELLRLNSLPFYVFMTLRTFAEQDALYAQGRTKPGKIVTNACGGDSWHNYGLACDLVLDGMVDKPGIQWSWDIRADLNRDGANDWKQMAELAKTLRLEAGYFWKTFPDAPHVQNRYGLSLVECKELYRLGGIDKVWSECQ